MKAAFTFRGAAWSAELRGRRVVLRRGDQEMAAGIWARGILTALSPIGNVRADDIRGIAVEAGAAIRQGQADEEKAPKELLPNEAAVRKDVEEAIGALPDLLLLSNPIGTAQFPTEKGKFRYVDYGLEVGSPDMVGLLGYRLRYAGPVRPMIGRLHQHDGHFWVRGAQWIGLELKAPGKVPKPHQKECHRRWRAHGAWIAPAITSGAEALAFIEESREMLRLCGAEPCALDRALLVDGGA